MKKIVSSVKGVFAFFLRLVIVILVLGLFLFGPMITYWVWEENRNIAACVEEGITYEKCYELYNW